MTVLKESGFKQTGRVQAALTPTALERYPDPFSRGHDLPDLFPPVYSFSLYTEPQHLIDSRPPTSFQIPAQAFKGRLNLDQYVTAINWSDASQTQRVDAAISGEITLTLPDSTDPGSIDIDRGYTVTLEVTWGSQTYELWTMRAKHPKYSETNGTLTVAVYDDMTPLKRAVQQWVFRTSKKHKRGFRMDEVIRAVCNRLNVKIGAIARGSSDDADLLKHFSRAQNGYLMIVDAIIHENQKTGRQYVMRFVRGALYVTERVQNPVLYALVNQMESVEYERVDQSVILPYTAVIGTGRIGKGKSGRVVVTKPPVFDARVIEQYGYLPISIDFGIVTSVTDLRNQAKRYLALLLLVENQMTITIPGLPFLRVGDMVEVSRPKVFKDSKGRDQESTQLWISELQHQVDAGGAYQSSMSMVQKDPYKTYRDAKELAAREAARKRRPSKVKAGIGVVSGA